MAKINCYATDCIHNKKGLCKVGYIYVSARNAIQRPTCETYRTAYDVGKIYGKSGQ